MGTKNPKEPTGPMRTKEDEEGLIRTKNSKDPEVTKDTKEETRAASSRLLIPLAPLAPLAGCLCRAAAPLTKELTSYRAIELKSYLLAR